MSPRAAWRLEQLGFGAVFDYAAGQPTEGPGPTAPRVVSALDRDVPVCPLRADVAAAATDCRARGWPVCVVVNDGGVVAGLVLVDKIASDDHRSAQEAMDAGPSTIRAHDELASTRARMVERHVAVLQVTTPEGILLGAVRLPN